MGKLLAPPPVPDPGARLRARSGRNTWADHQSRTTDTPTLQRLVYTPLLLTAGASFDQIFCETTAGLANALIRLGIYADDGTGWPGAVILKTAALDASGTGAISATIAWAPAPGLYWTGYCAQTAAATFRASSTFSRRISSSLQVTTSQPSSLYEANVSGALPDVANPTNELNIATLVGLRAA
jgi:hypothetical protein